MSDVKEIFIEVHERGQSFMNNKWGWDTNIALLTSGKFITKEYKVCIEIKHLFLKLILQIKSFHIRYRSFRYVRQRSLEVLHFLQESH